MSSRQPHVEFPRLLLDDPRFVDSLLRERVPPEMAVLLTDEGFDREESSFEIGTLETADAHGVFSTRCRDGKTLYVILVFQSTVDPEMPLLMYEYALTVWLRHQQREEGKTKTSPYIRPLVIYYGAEPWNVPLSVAEMEPRPRDTLRHETDDLVPTRRGARLGDVIVRKHSRKKR